MNSVTSPFALSYMRLMFDIDPENRTYPERKGESLLSIIFSEIKSLWWFQLLSMLTPKMGEDEPILPTKKFNWLEL